MIVYMADSSWYQHRPRGGRRFHAASDDGMRSACGLPMLDRESGTDHSGLPLVLLCQRRACVAALRGEEG